jgi:hypothetical protein
MDDIPRALSEVINYLNNVGIIKSTVSREKATLLRQSAELSDLIKSAPDLLVTYHKLFRAGKLSTMGFNPTDLSIKWPLQADPLLSSNDCDGLAFMSADCFE